MTNTFRQTIDIHRKVMKVQNSGAHRKTRHGGTIWYHSHLQPSNEHSITLFHIVGKTEHVIDSMVKYARFQKKRGVKKTIITLGVVLFHLNIYLHTVIKL
jgi:hypothetical protein